MNDRVRTVCRFYAWAQGRGWIESLPFQFVDVRAGASRRQSFLAHVDGRPGIMAANILTVGEHERLPRPLRVDQLRRVFAHLEMPYRLMAEWALATGLRRKELCGLAVFAEAFRAAGVMGILHYLALSARSWDFGQVEERLGNVRALPELAHSETPLRT
ncbi:hypothetical protein [Sinorhizobium medicae]|uniref:hypothetical protein n=1 Tax=Sinorhizobium medicae TaxID=110321 RepID=UPI002B1BD85C|nr:hypothetical protein [Sinorhizobium medicae]